MYVIKIYEFFLNVCMVLLLPLYTDAKKFEIIITCFLCIKDQQNKSNNLPNRNTGKWSA